MNIKQIAGVAVAAIVIGVLVKEQLVRFAQETARRSNPLDPANADLNIPLVLAFEVDKLWNRFFGNDKETLENTGGSW